TSRRKKQRSAIETAPRPASARAAPIRDSGPELLRRVLLGLVTALIVARPLVLGEDPGLLDQSSSATGLVLTVLWLLAAVGCAVWRASSGAATWPVSADE